MLRQGTQALNAVREVQALRDRPLATVTRSGGISDKITFPFSMGAEDAFGDRPGFHQHEAQKHRIADTAPNRADRISACGDTLNEHRIDGNADENQHPLKAHGKQGAQIILAHRAKLSVGERRHGDGG